MQDRTEQDRRLVRTALAGDENAFAELVGRFQRMVAGIAWRYGFGPADVEDLTSEVFLKMHRNLHMYRPEHPFQSWLYRLATNVVLDHGRRRRREPGVDELPLTLVDEGQDTASGAERSERAAMLYAAMERLAPHYRNVLFLVHIEGRSVEEAASILEAPSGTIKSRLLRGRQALGRLLEEAHPDTFGTGEGEE